MNYDGEQNKTEPYVEEHKLQIEQNKTIYITLKQNRMNPSTE